MCDDEIYLVNECKLPCIRANCDYTSSHSLYRWHKRKKKKKSVTTDRPFSQIESTKRNSHPNNRANSPYNSAVCKTNDICLCVLCIFLLTIIPVSQYLQVSKSERCLVFATNENERREEKLNTNLNWRKSENTLSQSYKCDCNGPVLAGLNHNDLLKFGFFFFSSFVAGSTIHVTRKAKMSSAYDHLFKLLIIGDSGEWARHFFPHHLLNTF